jgi:hypothetical protein
MLTETDCKVVCGWFNGGILCKTVMKMMAFYKTENCMTNGASVSFSTGNVLYQISAQALSNIIWIYRHAV